MRLYARVRACVGAAESLHMHTYIPVCALCLFAVCTSAPGASLERLSLVRHCLVFLRLRLAVEYRRPRPLPAAGARSLASALAPLPLPLPCVCSATLLQLTVAYVCGVVCPLYVMYAV